MRSGSEILPTLAMFFNKEKYMKGGQNLAHLQQKAKEEASWVTPQPCMKCGKVVKGAYGMWVAGWTCSLACEAIHQKEVTCAAENATRLFEEKMDTGVPSSTT